MIYPETKRINAVEEHFGTMIADPYRWLEDDVRRSPDVAAWVAARNQIARDYLDGLPMRDVFRTRLPPAGRGWKIRNPVWHPRVPRPPGTERETDDEGS